MSKENLISDLERLRAEIARVAGDNPGASRKLDTLINDLEKRISDTTDHDNDDLIEQVKNEITQFEAEHPRATAILNDILVTLSNMGI